MNINNMSYNTVYNIVSEALDIIEMSSANIANSKSIYNLLNDYHRNPTYVSYVFGAVIGMGISKYFTLRKYTRFLLQLGNEKYDKLLPYQKVGEIKHFKLNCQKFFPNLDTNFDESNMQPAVDKGTLYLLICQHPKNLKKIDFTFRKAKTFIQDKNFIHVDISKNKLLLQT